MIINTTNRPSGATDTLADDLSNRDTEPDTSTEARQRAEPDEEAAQDIVPADEPALDEVDGTDTPAALAPPVAADTAAAQPETQTQQDAAETTLEDSDPAEAESDESDESVLPTAEDGPAESETVVDNKDLASPSTADEADEPASSEIVSDEPDSQTDEAVQQVADSAAESLEAAARTIQELESDPVIEELLGTLAEWAAQVQNEHEPGGDQVPGFAAKIALAVTQQELSTEYTTLVAARMFAIEWDIDPEGAVNLLDSLAE